MSTVRLTREQIRAVDRICVERYGIPGIVLMENAARALCDAAVAMLPEGGRALIVCGGGNNGGDGYAVARHLHNAGVGVTLLAARPPESLEGDARINADIARRMSLAMRPATEEAIAQEPGDLLVDALLGTGLDRPPREDAARLIRAMNARGLPILAVDVPSGLDCDTGRPLGEEADCIRATRTVTMAAEKVGFAVGARWLGVVTVGDIGAPPEAIEAARA